MHKRFRSFTPSFKESRLIFEDPVVPPEPVVPPVTPPVVPPVVPPADPAKDPNSSEGRISLLAEENKRLKKEAKERADADKLAEEKRLSEAGEHQKLAEQYKNESTTEKAAREAAETKVTKYETQMKKQIETQLIAITDKEKKEKITALLGDKPVEEQMEMLPNLLGLMGVTATSFGGPTPTSTKTPAQNTDETKQKRFDELLLKAVKERLNPQEQQEKDKLARELSTYLKS